ncbi:MAG: adenylate/guanylate cyclase domain-containing protein [Gaiellales bacterium]
MGSLPDGTVTFLFTDVEGSTRLLNELGPDGYAEVLAEHRSVLREAFQQHGGVEVDTQGDAFFVAFHTAPKALEAALEALRALSVPVRMGIHTGTPLLTPEGYVGADVHRAARIAAAGHGGQLLISAATAALLEGAPLRDLGEHRLKDLSAPERLFQLGDQKFPPLRALHHTNLPVPATSFLGRARELGEVMELIGRDDVRLLALTGPGGSGKTRLALQAAAAAAEGYPQGVWWVPLAPLTDAADVTPAAARALGGGGPLPEVVGNRRLLLLLDNFEHVAPAATEVSALLAACPRVDVLVTSRERLNLQGEQVYPVPVLAEADAMELFVARARSARPDYEPDALVGELCARLDELPLALELAAARTSLLTSRQLLDRLGGRLDLRGGRDAETRQRTLRATIDWSYELLDPPEQRLLVALSVFRGGWTLDGAEDVCDADVDLLQSLVDKSLVRRWESGRFGMLETIREFAAERLAPDAREALLQRLLEHLLELLGPANLGDQETGLPQISVAQAERPNIDVALAWASGARDATAGLALLAALELYWATNDPVAGGVWVDRFLAAAGAEIAPRDLARALRMRGAAYDMTGQSDLSQQEYERASGIFRLLGDEGEAVHLMHRIASAALHEGDVERAIRLATDALEFDRREGHRRGEAMGLHTLARAAFAKGDRDEGIRLDYEAAAVAESVGFTWWRAVTLVTVAECLLAAGDADAASEPLVAGLGDMASVGDRVNMPIALAVAAALAARHAKGAEAGLLWGAVEAAAEDDPRGTTTAALGEYEPHLELVRGAAFDEARERGRLLSLEEAVVHARSHDSI